MGAECGKAVVTVTGIHILKLHMRILVTFILKNVNVKSCSHVLSSDLKERRPFSSFMKNLMHESTK